MSRFDDEPLSPEERALADRLARLGPHDGPSPALDAKILAAAHAAVAPPQRRQRRWLGLTALPGGLITGAGMAAALVLVIGTVWQLRPSDPAPRPAAAEGDAGPVSAQMITRRKQVIAPPPPPAEAPANAQAPAAPAAARAPAPPLRKAMTAADTAAPAPRETAQPTPAYMPTVGPDEARHGFEEAVADAPAAATYSAPAAAPAPPVQSAYSEAERSEAFELARARQKSSDDEAASARRAAMAAAAPASTAPVAREQTTLDRIEVNGGDATSAKVLADIPVTEDARLEPAPWLERIRERRDAGDLEGARASLTLFRKAHPRVPLPTDLRALARSTTRR